VKPFTITCTTCQARLSVRKASAIGQILSCPKCQSMVQVEAPPGWRPDDEPPEPAESAGRSLQNQGNLPGGRHPKNRQADKQRDAQRGDAASRPADAGLHQTTDSRSSDRRSVDQPPGRPRQEGTWPEDTSQDETQPDMWRSPQEQTARKLLLLVGAPVVALALAWGGWSLLASRSAPDDSPPAATSQVTAAPTPAGDPSLEDTTASKADAPIELESSIDIRSADLPIAVEAWLPRDTHYVAVARPADVRDWASALSPQEAGLPHWWLTLTAAIDGLNLDASTIDRAFVAECDVNGPESNSPAELRAVSEPEQFVILFQLAAPGTEPTAIADGGQLAGFSLGKADGYLSGDATWSYPWALVDSRTLVTGTRAELERLNMAFEDGSSSPEGPPPDSSLARLLAVGRPTAEPNAWLVAVDRDAASHFDGFPSNRLMPSSGSLATERSALSVLPRLTAVGASALPHVACEIHWQCDDGADAIEVAEAVEQLLALSSGDPAATTGSSEPGADVTTLSEVGLLNTSATTDTGSPLALLPWWQAGVPWQKATVEVDAETVVLRVSWAEDLEMLTDLAAARFEAIKNTQTTTVDVVPPVPESPPVAVSPMSVEEIPRDRWFDPTEAPAPSPDVATRLATPLDGVDLPEIRLVDWLDFVSQITGLRITLDLRTLTAMGLTADWPIQVSASKTTVGEALAVALAELDLAFVVWGDHVVVTQRARNESDLDVRQHEIDELVRNVDDAARLAEVTQRLVRPDVWHTPGGTASIEVAGGSLEVRGDQAVHRLVKQWLTALRAARVAGAAGSMDSASDAILWTRRWQAAATLDQPVTVNFFDPTPIRTILDTLERATGAILLVDAHALAEAESAADDTATLVVDGKPLGEALEELAESLGLAIWVADERTAQITTRGAVRQRFEVAFYDVATAAGADATPEAILGPLEQAISERCGDAAFAGGEWYFDTASGYLAVFQSQPVHVEIKRYFDAKQAAR